MIPNLHLCCIWQRCYVHAAQGLLALGCTAGNYNQSQHRAARVPVLSPHVRHLVPACAGYDALREHAEVETHRELCVLVPYLRAQVTPSHYLEQEPTHVARFCNLQFLW